MQWHTVLLRPCKMDKYKLPDGYAVLEQVGLYLPHPELCHHPNCLHLYVGFGHL